MIWKLEYGGLDLNKKMIILDVWAMSLAVQTLLLSIKRTLIKEEVQLADDDIEDNLSEGIAVPSLALLSKIYQY